MKTLYFDCGMGAAGDMLAAALMELLPNPEEFINELNALGIPGVKITKENAVKCGITGTHFSVAVNGKEEESLDTHSHRNSSAPSPEHFHENGVHINPHEQTCGDDALHHHEHCHSDDSPHHHEHSPRGDSSYPHEHSHGHGTSHSHHHAHRGLHDIEHIVRDHLSLPETIKKNIMAVYRLIADGESHVHGVPVTEIHFHEVGTMDALADITAVCLLMDKIAPEEVIASPICTGSGQVQCAHGILPVPAPATAHILKGIPIYSGNLSGELCTPTGAALLKHFVSRFEKMPEMRLHAIGYGMGKKDFEMANCVRAMLGERGDQTDTVLELSCNVDDMTGESMGFAMDRLLEGGALEVYTIPIGMKKSRPGTLICVLCRERDKDRLLSLLFKYTTTLGIRQTKHFRYILKRSITTLETPYGTVRRKDSEGYGVSRSKYEYQDLVSIAEEKNLSITDVISLIRKWQDSSPER